jgi:hypothetical protein
MFRKDLVALAKDGDLRRLDLAVVNMAIVNMAIVNMAIVNMAIVNMAIVRSVAAAFAPREHDQTQAGRQARPRRSKLTKRISLHTN